MREKRRRKTPVNSISDHSKTWLNGLPYVRKYLYSMIFIESCSAHTERAYKIDLAQAFFFDPETLIPTSEAPGPSISETETEHLLGLVREAQRRWGDLGPATRNRKTATLKSFLGWLHREGHIERDLAAVLHSPKVPSRLPKHLSVDEAIALIRTIEAEVQASRSASSHAYESALIAQALVSLLYGGGLRVSEACELETKNVDLVNGTCRVLGKGSKERVIALPKLTSHAIAALMRDRKAPYVFGEQALSTRVAYDIVRKAGVRAGLLKPLHPHALRHSYATHLLRSGANLRVLQALLGHATLQATSRYTHIGIDDLARTLEAHHPTAGRSKA